MTTNEPAGVWVRVSTGRQDEANQVPDVERHCAARGYVIARRYELNDKSASKGEQQAMQDQVIADMREGAVKILVCWHTDRVERRGPEALFGFIRRIKDAGGRIESTKEPLLGDESMSGETLTAFGAIASHQFSIHLAEQIKLAQDEIRRNYAVLTCLPWGYHAEGPKKNKKAVPSDECREYWPKVLQRCVAGDSCRTIAAWLDSEDVKPIRGGKWDEGVIRRYVRNPVYCGRRLGWGKDVPLLPDEAVVPVDMWVAANDALKNRPKQGPRTGKLNPVRPMLAELRCLRCGSPMYRIHAGSRDRNNFYYRCAGQGPQRKGCGNMVPFAQTEVIVTTEIYMTSNEPFKDRRWVEGQSWDAEIADILQQMRELDPESEEDEAIRDALKAQLKELRRKNETEATIGGWREVETKFTEGEVFDKLPNDAKREYLSTRDIRVEKAVTEHGLKAVHVVIDGQDHGVWPYPPKIAATE
jgi:hypothetical protein